LPTGALFRERLPWAITGLHGEHRRGEVGLRIGSNRSRAFFSSSASVGRSCRAAGRLRKRAGDCLTTTHANQTVIARGHQQKCSGLHSQDQGPDEGHTVAHAHKNSHRIRSTTLRMNNCA